VPSGPSELISKWRALWLASIDEIACGELQRATWLSPLHGNPHWTFVMFRDEYFGQFGLRDGYEYAIQNHIVSEQEAAAVQPFHRLLDDYEPPNGNRYDHAAILADPNWEAVIAVARDAHNKLLALSFNNPTYLGSFKNA
jgi:hypothetical protein